MSFKILFLCAQMCLIKTVFSQCLGPNAYITEGLGLMGAGSVGPFASTLLLENYPMPTPGLSIFTDDLVIEGLVSVSGSLPFLGTVALEGLLPTEGLGSVVYGCGNGEIGIVGENVGPYGPGLPGPAIAGPALAGPAFTGPIPGPFPGAMGPGYPAPMGPAYPAPTPGYSPYGGPCSAPMIDPGMAAAANTAAMAAAANSAGQAAVRTSVGIGAAANASGLTAMAGL